MLKVIHKCNVHKKPEVLVITPLKTGHKISKITRKTIKRNDVDFDWVSYESDQIRPLNIEQGLDTYFKLNGYDLNKMPKYILPLDDNIELGRHYIDRLYNALKKSNRFIGYTYGNLEYKGEVNKKFPVIKFDLEKLLQSNYISSNSLFKLDCLMEVGLVTDESMLRLLDWAFLIQMARHGYIGEPVPLANHVAWTNKENISSRSQSDYAQKSRTVFTKIIHPFIKEIQEAQKLNEKREMELSEPEDNVLVL